MTIFTNSYAAATDDAGQYIQAVLELVGNRDPIEILRQLPEALRDGTAGLEAAELRRPEADGKWSMIEILAHLSDSELVWACRLRMVLAEADPVLTGYDQDRWARYLRYGSRDLTMVLAEIQLLRDRNLLLIESLDDDELDRSGRHSERGRETVRHMIRLYAGHDLVHRAQLERVRRTVARS